MRRTRTMPIGACLAVLVLTLPTLAWGQVRIQILADGQVSKDRTSDLPWRKLQQGLISIDDVTARCPSVTQDPATPAEPGDANDLTPQFLNSKRPPNCMFNDVVRIDFLNTSDEQARCTGVMIADNLVLSAGHCACGKPGSYVLRKHGDRASDENNADVTPKYALSRPPVLFDGYSCEFSPEFQPGRDLAVMVIESFTHRDARANGLLTLNFDQSHHEGLNVATTGQLFSDRKETNMLIGAGYGEIDDGSLPEQPQFSAIPIASLFCAQGRFAQSNCSAYREFVLADSLLRQSGRLSDSCGGDSGAPIMYMPPDLPHDPQKPDANASQGIMLVGITSRGLNGVSHQTRSRCGGGGVYTAVGHPDVVAWLQSFGVSVFTIFPRSQGAER